MNINEIIDQIEHGLEGVSPGPWACVEVKTQVGRAFRIGAGEMIEKGKGACIIYDDYPCDPDNQRSRNAAHIARCDPDTMRAIIDAYRTMEARAEAAEVKVAMAQNLLKRVPMAINSAFAAGTEEREGGSDRRQAKAMAGPEILKQEIRAALAAMEATDE